MRPTPPSRSSGARLEGLPYLLLGLGLLIAVQGCALGGGGRSGGSGLSQAAKEAKKEPDEKKKRLHAGERLPQEDDDDDESVVIVERESDVAPPPSSDASPANPGTIEVSRSEPHGPKSIYSRFHLGTTFGFGMLSGDNFGGYGSGGLQVGGFPAPRVRLDLTLLGIGANFSETSGLNQSFKREHELAADVSGRYYLTREHTFVGVYPLLGVRFGMLLWDYATPILVEDNGTRQVTADDLVYFSPYVGFGTSLVQTRHFHLGVQLIGGGRIYSPHTGEGLANDLFNDGGFAQLQFEATVPF